jgi:hypothetical protein
MPRRRAHRIVAAGVISRRVPFQILAHKLSEFCLRGSVNGGVGAPGYTGRRNFGEEVLELLLGLSNGTRRVVWEVALSGWLRCTLDPGLVGAA